MGNYTRWYRVGKVKLVNGSRTIEGTDTYWLVAGLNPGDLFTIDGAQFYEVDAITDNTHLTLKNTYAGVSVNDSAYSIIRNFTATMPADIAARTAELLGDFRKYIDTDMRSIHGESAYELAVQNGFVGTEQDWLNSLKAGGELAELQSDLADFQTSADDRITALESGQGDLSGLNTSAKGSLVLAINEVLSSAGALSALTTASRVSLVSAINELVSHVGTLSSLSTSAKGHLVAAINEVLANEGALSSLTTTAKTTLVAAVNELDARTKVFAEARSLGNAGFAHNLIYRGKCLGDKPTAAQLAAIADGTFDDMYLGDYWNGVGEDGWTGLHWMIVHFNYFAADWGGAYIATANNDWTNRMKARGFTTTHYAPHVTVMQMKSASASAAKGLPRYTSAPTSDLTDEVGQLKDWYNNALIPTFGDEHVIPTLCHLRQVNTQGLPNGGGWHDIRRVFIPYYSQITGIVFPCSDGTIRRTAYDASGPSRFSTNEKQFAAFQVAGFMLNDFGTKTAHGDFWLRDMVGPNGSGTPMGLFIQNDDYIGRVRPYNYTTGNSTFHVYATIA